MIIFAAIVITFVLLITIIAICIAAGNRAIVAEMDQNLNEALAAIEIARRVHLRRRPV